MINLGLVVGLDLSLKAAGVGVALITDEGYFGFTETYGYSLPMKAPLEDRLDRIDAVGKSVSSVLDMLDAVPLLIAIEEMPYGASGASTHDRAVLWADVVRGIRRRGWPWVAVNVSKLKIYTTGQGNKVTKEEIAIETAKRYPDVDITNNNEADGWGLAAMAARMTGNPLEDSLPKTHLRALDGLEIHR